MRAMENVGLPVSCIIKFCEENMEGPAEVPSLTSMYLQQKEQV